MVKGSTCRSLMHPAAVKELGWRAAWTKLTFLLFCWLSLLLFVAGGALLYYLVSFRLRAINIWLDRAAAAAFLSGALMVTGGLLLITLTALTGIDLLYPHKKRSVTVKILFPIAAAMSQILGVNRNILRTSFVKVNNALTKAQKGRIRGQRILVLLPHCLQIDICNRKLTTDVNNCMRCGKCPVGGLITMGETLGLDIEVVNGGTLARQKVATLRPDGIVAVACERDLTLGIQDVYPIPVYGVINDRPHGPCFNTCVDMKLVEEGIAFFKKDLPPNPGKGRFFRFIRRNSPKSKLPSAVPSSGNSL
jgi:uncharacterized protein